MTATQLPRTVETGAWEPVYERILDDLGYSREDDRRSAELLDQLLAGKPSVDEDDLRLTLGSGRVVVFGAAETIEEDAQLFAEYQGPTIAADGAVPAVVDAGITPDLVVTDLDGAPALQARLSDDGVPLAVHAHGDNRDALEQWVPELDGPLLGTCQCSPDGLERVVNHGGFTDGDRACCLAVHYGASHLTLVGWDFQAATGEKAKKLDWAERIVDDLPVPVEVV